MSATPMLKLLSMADSCLVSLPVSFASMNSSRLLPLSSKAIICPLFSCFSSTLSSSPLMLSLRSKNIASIVPIGAHPSGWLGEQSSDWNEGDAIDDGESRVNEGSVHGDAGESYPEVLEEAKLFVGNLPFDIDSEKLAHLFKKAGVVEVSEVIYNRQTAQSRGFGFVTMSTVEDAERAVELFHSYDYNGRLLTVNKAAARGSRFESPRFLDPSFRIYVGNLSWQVDDARLEQLFSEHGKVSNARVVYDRETGRSRGFGFVTMASQTELNDAIAALDGQSFDGRAIRVNVAEERQRRGSF